MKSTIDKDYFKNLDSEHKYYQLGFLHADGYLKMYDKGPRFSVHLSSVDKYWVERFKQDTKAPNKLQQYQSNFNFPVCRIEISDREFLKPLFDIELKDENILARIPNKYKNAFIRGVFDGNGSAMYRQRFYKKENKTYTCIGWELCSPLYNFLESISDHLNKELGLKKPKTCVNSSIWDIRYESTKAVKKLYDYIYKDANFYLTRKKEILEKGLKEKKLI